LKDANRVSFTISVKKGLSPSQFGIRNGEAGIRRWTLEKAEPGGTDSGARDSRGGIKKAVNETVAAIEGRRHRGTNATKEEGVGGEENKVQPDPAC